VTVSSVRFALVKRVLCIVISYFLWGERYGAEQVLLVCMQRALIMARHSHNAKA
jgi:hypothetical protein